MFVASDIFVLLLNVLTVPLLVLVPCALVVLRGESGVV